MTDKNSDNRANVEIQGIVEGYFGGRARKKTKEKIYMKIFAPVNKGYGM